MADFLGVSNLMAVDIVERGPGARCQARLGETVLTVAHGGQDAPDRSHAVIRPERVRIEEFGSAGPNRVPAMVERLVYLGSSTQVFLRLAAGRRAAGACCRTTAAPAALARARRCMRYLAPDALRVLPAAAGQAADDEAVAIDHKEAVQAS